MSFRVSFCSWVFSVLLVLRLPRLGKSELILVLFVRLFGLCLFRFVGFLFLLGSGKGCGLWLWHSLDFSLTFFIYISWFCHICWRIYTSSKKSVQTWIIWRLLFAYQTYCNWRCIWSKGEARANKTGLTTYPASILHKSTAGRNRPVSYPDGPITARYRFM